MTWWKWYCLPYYIISKFDFCPSLSGAGERTSCYPSIHPQILWWGRGWLWAEALDCRRRWWFWRFSQTGTENSSLTTIIRLCAGATFGGIISVPLFVLYGWLMYANLDTNVRSVSRKWSHYLCLWAAAEVVLLRNEMCALCASSVCGPFLMEAVKKHGENFPSYRSAVKRQHHIASGLILESFIRHCKACLCAHCQGSRTYVEVYGKMRSFRKLLGSGSRFFTCQKGFRKIFELEIKIFL